MSKEGWTDAQEKERIDKEFAKKSSELAAELERSAPNMKV